MTDFWNYGGLTRDVSLVELPETFIEDYWVQLAKGSLNEIEGWVKLNGASAPQQVTLAIPEAGIKQLITTDNKGYGHFRFPANLDLWSPENPKLYQVMLSAALDSLTEQIGFRSIETRGSKIFLNGKPIFLRGVSLHEEAPFRGGRAFSEEDDQILLLGQRNSAATLSASLTILTTKRCFGWPIGLACWSGPRFRFTGKLRGRILPLSRMLSSSCAT